MDMIKSRPLRYKNHKDTINVYTTGCVDYLNQIIVIWI